VRIAYTSDLHLDIHGDCGKCFLNKLEVPECDLLVIAGDLVDVSQQLSLRKAFQTFCNKARNVLYVTGNHESYHSTLDISEARIREAVKPFPQIKIVSKAETFEIEGVLFLAGTLWFQDYLDQYLYKRFLNDFAMIKNLEPEIYNRNKEFDIALHGIKDEPCVVVSHHMPSYRSVNWKFAKSCINRFFVGGEFDSVIADSKIKYWIHGHSHDRVGYTIGNTKIVSNPLGYPNEIVYNWDVKVVDV
jgi:Icc-related predicted phosphoesterase